MSLLRSAGGGVSCCRARVRIRAMWGTGGKLGGAALFRDGMCESCTCEPATLRACLGLVENRPAPAEIQHPGRFAALGRGSHARLLRRRCTCTRHMVGTGVQVCSDDRRGGSPDARAHPRPMPRASFRSCPARSRVVVRVLPGLRWFSRPNRSTECRRCAAHLLSSSSF